MERRPAARASAARDNVAFTEVFRPGALAAIRARIPEASLHAIDHTPGFAWLEFKHDHHLMDATLAVLGEADAIACWRAGIRNLIEKPLLNGFVGGTLRLFGSQPGKVLKMLPKGWTLGYRDFCTPRYVSVDANRCEIHFENIAPQAFESIGYVHCWYSIALGVFDLTKPLEPQVDFEIDRVGALAVARFGWA